LHVSSVQAVPESLGDLSPAMNVQPSTSVQAISPWYAVLLVPFALLVVALAIQWRRQRE
jgi:hypothetical protein